MKRNIFKQFIAFMLVLTFVFSMLPNFAHAEEIDNVAEVESSGFTYNPDYYNDVLYGDGWQKEYTISVKKKDTGEIFVQKIKSINDFGFFTKEYFCDSLEEGYELVGFEVITNDKYKPKFGWVETAFDIGCLVLSAKAYKDNPSFWNGFELVVDTAAVALPGVPNVSGALKMIKKSDDLKDGLRLGVKPYKKLRKLTSGTRFDAHHIMPAVFYKLFNCSSKDNMLALAVDKKWHGAITARCNSVFDYDATYTRTFVRNKMKYIYQQMYFETDEEVFNFMANFIEEVGRFEP